MFFLKLFLKLFPLYALMLWAADDNNGGDSADDDNTDKGNADDDKGQSGNDKTSTGDDKTGGDKPAFTQADVDRIAGQTRKEAMHKWAKDHGFEGVKDLEEIIKAKHEADEQSKSDLTKAQETAQREKTAREQAEAELRKTKIEIAVTKKAAELNFAFPDDTLAFLNLSAVEVDDGGKITGFDKQLEDLAKSGRLPMKGQQQQQSIGNQTRTNRGSSSANTQQQPERTERIVRF